MNRLKRLTPGDKNRILILFCATLVALYFGLRYPQLSAELSHEANMVNRKLNRLEVRKQDVPTPKVSAGVLEKRLADLTDEKDRLEGRLVGLRRGFATLESTEELQLLWLEVSSLARDSRLDVQQMQGYGSSGRNGSTVTSVDFLAQEANNRYQRPLVKLRASGSFSQLMSFLRGLQRLSYNVSVVRVGINARPPASGREAGAAKPLDFDLLLAM